MNLGELTPFHGCHDFKLFYASAIDDYDCEGEFKWTGRIRSDKEDHVLNPCPRLRGAAAAARTCRPLNLRAVRGCCLESRKSSLSWRIMLRCLAVLWYLPRKARIEADRA